MKKALEIKKKKRQHTGKEVFHFDPNAEILPRQTELDERIFNSLWHLKLGWNWKETSQGKCFFNTEGDQIMEDDLYLEQSRRFLMLALGNFL